MMERLAALRGVLCLRGLPDEALEDLARAGRERTLERGELLAAEHQRSLGLIVVLSGAVRVYKIDPRGRELTMGIEGPGSSVAEIPLFDGGNYPARVESWEDGTTVLIVPRDRYLETLSRYPDVAANALRALSIRMRRLLNMLEVQSLHPVRSRLASYLLTAAAGREEFRLEETNEAIASQVGTVREVVSRTLRSFREARVIEVTGRTVRIKDEAGLKRIADARDG